MLAYPHAEPRAESRPDRAASRRDIISGGRAVALDAETHIRQSSGLQFRLSSAWGKKHMPPNQSNLIHRKIEFDGRPTSLRLEPEFWHYLAEIAYERRVTRAELISVINQHKGKDVSLAAALRVFVAQHYRDAAS